MIITVDTDKESPAGLRRAAKLLEEFASKAEGKEQFSFPHEEPELGATPEPAPKPKKRDPDLPGSLQVY